MNSQNEDVLPFSEQLKRLHKLSIQLSRAETLDTFCRMAVEGARNELGFDRFSVWLYNEDRTVLHGTYGTDEQGNTRDEHALTWTVFDPWLLEFDDNSTPVNVHRDAPLRNYYEQEVDRGWNVTVALRDGDSLIGVCSVDNVIHHRPLLSTEVELLGLYGSLVAHLYARKKAEESLKESEAFLKMSQEASLCGSWKWNPHTNHVVWSEEMCYLHGISQEEFQGTLEHTASFFVPEDRLALSVQIERILKAHIFDPIVYRITRTDGEERTLLGRGTFHLDTHGQIDTIIGTVVDITETNQTKTALQQREEELIHLSEQLKKLHEISMSISQSISLDELCLRAIEHLRNDLGFDRAGIGLYNDTKTVLTGMYGTDESGGTKDEHTVIWNLESSLTIQKHNHTLPINVHYDNPLYTTGAEMEEAGRGWQAVISLRDGDDVVGMLSADNLIHGKPLLQSEIELLALYGSVVGHLYARKRADIERQRLEEQIRHTQRMESIGQLAGGIAHDFNNLLTVITGYTEMVLGMLPLNSPMRTHLAHVSTSAERAATLTKQLLTYARRQKVDLQPLNLNQIIERMKPLLWRTIGENYLLTDTLDATLWNVRANASQMEQVLTNLVINARDAMPNGGAIHIVTENYIIQSSSVQSIELPVGEYVRLAVTDKGTGIPLEVQSRIFEPFFTTKEVGKGSGLGLATCYGIVRQCSGSISVESEIGAGTTFQVFLPRLKADIVVEPIEADESVVGGTETVLLVDDEPMVREVVAEILRRAGYCVIEANGAAQALLISTEVLDTVDILITDVVMPTMSGEELAHRLTDTHTNLSVLYISGYSDGVMLPGEESSDAKHLLAKPFSSTTLLKKVREILESK